MSHIKVLGEGVNSGTSDVPAHRFIKGHKSVILCKLLGYLIRSSQLLRVDSQYICESCTHPHHLASAFVMMGAASHMILTAQSVKYYGGCCTEVQSLTLCKMYSAHVHINAVDGLPFHIFSSVMWRSSDRSGCAMSKANHTRTSFKKFKLPMPARGHSALSFTENRFMIINFSRYVRHSPAVQWNSSLMAYMASSLGKNNEKNRP